MTTALLPIADGSEEMEAVTIADILVRAGIDVTIASVMPDKLQVVASRGVKLVADRPISECVDLAWDLIVTPGGMPGAEHLQKSAPLVELIKAQLGADKLTAAICASPTVVLGRNNLIPQYSATSYPAFQDELAKYVSSVKTDRVVVDRNLVTSQGPGTSVEFALQLVSMLVGEAKAEEVAKGMLITQFA